MNQAVFDPKPILENLPLLPGVYRFFDTKGEVLYVGKAKQLKKRVSSYFQNSNISPRIRLMVSHIASIETTVTRSEAEALLLENNLIKSLRPRYNILFRDDKSYPYIVLTSDTFPRLTYYRGAPNKQHQYFGPYPNVHAAKESLQLLQKMFRLRTCENSVFNHRERPCLLHQIKRCTAPCVGLIDQQAYQQDIRNTVLLLQGRLQEIEHSIHQQMMDASEKMLYEQAALFRDQLRALHTVQQKQFVESTGGATDADILVVIQQEQLSCVNLSMVRGGRHLGDKSFFPEHAEHLTAQEVLHAFISQHYLQRTIPHLLIVEQAIEHTELLNVLNEQAGRALKILIPTSGERRQWLEMGLKNAQLALTQKLERQGGQQRRLEKLQTWLDIPDLSRIECFDISHTQGEATQASCVVFEQGEMRSSQYRRYNISDITPGDDYAAMRQVLTRRYQKLLSEETPRPDLVLIDGGLGQLNVALTVMAELGISDLALIGVAKGEERKAGLEQLIFPNGRVQSLSPDDPALHLIQQIRDEAHRFAITGHRAKRAKARLISSLEEIEGVGEKRRRNLLTHFGGLREISQASVEQLAQVQGISKALAEKIYQQLH